MGSGEWGVGSGEGEENTPFPTPYSPSSYQLASPSRFNAWAVG